MADRVGIGVLTSAFPPELVDLAIEDWDAREVRSRKVPARLAAYYTMACAMYFDDAYGEVWNKLLSGLEWARRYRQRKDAGMQPSAAALTKARQRLGLAVRPLIGASDRVHCPLVWCWGRRPLLLVP